MKTISLLCLTLALALPGFALDEPASQGLDLRLPDGSVRRYTAFPASTVKLLFPEGVALLDREESQSDWGPSLAPWLKRVKLVKVSDTQRRFTIAGVIYAQQLFTFDELFCGDNLGVMSKLMQATQLFPRTADEALDVAKLYLSLTYYGFQHPARFVVSSADDIPPPKVTFPGESRDILNRILHSPLVTSAGPEYNTELFAADLDMRWIHRWRITFGEGGIHNVSDQKVYPYSEEMTEFYAHLEKSAVMASEENIQLSHCCFMANGYTKDGAETDIQLLAASNGPFVGRTHYYYKTREKADQLMQGMLGEAVAVIESGPWLDADGKKAGQRATLVLAGPDQTLSAVLLLKKDDNVLEFSSGCLRNLLALGRR